MSRMFVSLIVTALLVLFCHYFVDAELALFISRRFVGNSAWTRYTAAIPDLLFPLVCIITLVAVFCYLVRSRRGAHSPATSFFQLVAYAVPASFIGKTILKLIFGRINTRFWLHNPQLYGFHWFHGGGFYDGFPSGHMAVFTAFMAALWRIYPRSRRICLICLLALASALIVTNYHFLRDVLAGAYLGLLAEAVSHRVLHRQRPLPGQCASTPRTKIG